jgi:MFS family permease
MTSQRERILFLYFFVFGLGGASWLVRLPDVRQLLEITTAQLGWVIFAGAVGAMISLSLSGRFIARFGARAGVLWGFSLLSVGMTTQGIASQSGLPIVVAAGCFIAGIGYGIGDVGINIEGADAERVRGRTLLPQLHGAYSLGTLAGAALGTVCIAINLTVMAQMLGVVVLTIATPWLTYRRVPAATGQTITTVAPAAPEPDGLRTARLKRQLRVPGTRVVLLGLGIMGLSLAEGGANDWLALSIVDDYQQTTTIAGISFAVMMAAMVISRFMGGRIVDRFGRVRALRVTAAMGVLGIVLISLGHNIVLAWLGAALWGVGVSLGFPLYISAAADGENSAPRVSAVTTFGYVAFLVGPPLLGFLGQTWGLLNMFLLLAAVLAGTIYVAKAATPLEQE